MRAPHGGQNSAGDFSSISRVDSQEYFMSKVEDALQGDNTTVKPGSCSMDVCDQIRLGCIAIAINRLEGLAGRWIFECHDKRRTRLRWVATLGSVVQDELDCLSGPIDARIYNFRDRRSVLEDGRTVSSRFGLFSIIKILRDTS